MIFLVTGSGLSLDENWDLSINTASGDLDAENAGDELKKDLALLVTRGINNSKFTGGVLGDGQERDLGIYLRKLLRSDPRVESVDSVTVSSSRTDQRVDADVRLTAGTYTDDIDGDGESETVEFTFEDLV